MTRLLTAPDVANGSGDDGVCLGADAGREDSACSSSGATANSRGSHRGMLRRPEEQGVSRTSGVSRKPLSHMWLEADGPGAVELLDPHEKTLAAGEDCHAFERVPGLLGDLGTCHGLDAVHGLEPVADLRFDLGRAQDRVGWRLGRGPEAGRGGDSHHRDQHGAGQHSALHAAAPARTLVMRVLGGERRLWRHRARGLGGDHIDRHGLRLRGTGAALAEIEVLAMACPRASA